MAPSSLRLSRILILLALLTSACATNPSAAPTASGPSTLTVMTHDSFAISETALAEFQNAHNVKLQFLTSGDAGSLINKAILARQNPLADVIFGFDNTFLSRALDGDILDPYAAPALSAIPAEFQLDPSQRALPIDYGDVCVNYDLAYLAEHDLAAPNVLEDLLKPEYRGLLVVQNPATSSPGLAFLLATVGHFGEAGYLDYWRGLVANDVLVVNDWESAYNTEFTRGGGTRPLVVSYGSSPAFEVLYASEPVTTTQTGVMTGPGSCYRQIEFAGIIKGTTQRALAEQFLDFLLGPTFQADIPLQMFVFPVVSNTPLDETFARYLAVPEAPAQVDPARIASQREAWIAAWTEVVLR